MTLVYRGVKGSPLEDAEIDGNFSTLDADIVEVAEDLATDVANLAAYHTESHTWTGPQRGAFVSLTSTSALITVDLDAGNNFNHTLTEDTTLAAPTNAVAGQSGVIHFTQHVSTAKTLAFASFWEFGIDATYTMTTTLSGTAVMTYIIDPVGTSASCSWMNKS